VLALGKSLHLLQKGIAQPPLLMDFPFQQVQECFTVGFIYKDFVSGIPSCRNALKRSAIPWEKIGTLPQRLLRRVWEGVQLGLEVNGEAHPF
jgi:hypothetical protein